MSDEDVLKSKDIGQTIYEEVRQSRFDLKKLFSRFSSGLIIFSALFLPLVLSSCDEKEHPKSEPSLIEHILDSSEKVPYDDPWLQYYTTCTTEIQELRNAWDRDPNEEIDEFPLELQVEAALLASKLCEPFYDKKTISLENYFSSALHALNFSVRMVNKYKEVFDVQLAQSLFVPYSFGFKDQFNVLGVDLNSSKPILGIYDGVLNALTVVTNSIWRNEAEEFLLVHLYGLRLVANNARTLSSLGVPYTTTPLKAEVEIPPSLLGYFQKLTKEFRELYESLYPTNSSLYGPVVSFKALNKKVAALERIALNHIKFLERKKETTFGSVCVVSGELPFYKEWLSDELNLDELPATFTHTSGAVLEVDYNGERKTVNLPMGARYQLSLDEGRAHYLYHVPDRLDLISIYIWNQPVMYCINIDWSWIGRENLGLTRSDTVNWGIITHDRSGKFE